MTNKQRNTRTRAAERKALERAMLRTMRKLWVRDTDTKLGEQTQAVLLGLELARRAVR